MTRAINMLHTMTYQLIYCKQWRGTVTQCQKVPNRKENQQT